MNFPYDIFGLSEKNDMWEELRQSKKPIVMYGMGDGADKILAVLESRGISVSDFFASDGFVRGQTFHSKKVLSFSEIKNKYEDFVIILSFGSSRREVLDFIYSLDDAYDVRVPDLPVCGNGLFDKVAFLTEYDNVIRARSLLSDERSVNLFDDLVRYKLSGKIEFLRNNFSTVGDMYNELLPTEKYVTALDLGAYIGDSAVKMTEYFGNIRRIIAVEPDKRSFGKLSLFADGITGVRILPINVCVADFVGETRFSQEGNRNSSVNGRKKQSTVKVSTVDSIVGDEKIDYIKIDVEGNEAAALRGGLETMKRCMPDIALSVYHRANDFFELILYLHEICPEYRLYLRRPEYLPPWDVTLFALSNCKDK